MKRFRNRLIAILLVLEFIFPAWSFSASPGHFSAVMGDVKITRAGKTTPAQVKMGVESGDIIKTGAGAEAKLLFQDESTITIAQNTTFRIDEFVIKDQTRKASFFTSLGKIVVDVKKFIGGESSFIVRSPTAVAGVRGTGFEFVVSEVAGQIVTTVTCTAGSLTVSAVAVTGEIISTMVITAGQTAIISSSGITLAAAAATAAQAAGAAAGTAAVAGVQVGTIAAAAVVAAAVAVGIATSTSSGPGASAHHTTGQH
ncbi:MAG: FecR domain-containing protein [Syntrophales bacterium]|nr:FecR domain-containing protein [Syntrophales bacterium]